jgi:hypothetical protein
MRSIERITRQVESSHETGTQTTSSEMKKPYERTSSIIHVLLTVKNRVHSTQYMVSVADSQKIPLHIFPLPVCLFIRGFRSRPTL